MSRINMEHEDYLKLKLSSFKLELRENEISHRVRIAEYNVLKEFYNVQVASIEKQLEDNNTD